MSFDDGVFNVIDLFAGAGGWSQALRGRWESLGIDIDKDACATATAAGHSRLQLDVSSLDPSDFGNPVGIVASPPCPTFSMAGQGSGRRDLDLLLATIKNMGASDNIDEEVQLLTDVVEDARSALVVQPLRWVLEMRPMWTAWEQVPAVLPLWQACAEVLRANGYSVWTDRITSEQYGVPQTRQRAILIASRDGRTDEELKPRITHRKYRKGVAQHEGDETLEPWISMAEALAWEPGQLVGFPRRSDNTEEKTSEVIAIDGVEYRARDLRSTEFPAQAVTHKARSWQLRNGPQSRATVRDIDEPAATITAAHDTSGRVWVNGTGANAAVRPESDPAPTIHFGRRLNTVEWRQARNAGPGAQREPRDAATDPSYTIRANGSGMHPSGVEWRNDPNSGPVRVTVQEASVLQTFPVDYPLQGSMTARFRQIGDAVPPLLAQVIVATASGETS